MDVVFDFLLSFDFGLSIFTDFIDPVLSLLAPVVTVRTFTGLLPVNVLAFFILFSLVDVLWFLRVFELLCFVLDLRREDRPRGMCDPSSTRILDFDSPSATLSPVVVLRLDDVLDLDESFRFNDGLCVFALSWLEVFVLRLGLAEGEGSFFPTEEVALVGLL